ncbi:MAG TPA: hypothetical protein PK364_05905 [Synergistaceae bacterium]|nr:hypothetical protein [Synergistaceae bacterium]
MKPRSLFFGFAIFTLFFSGIASGAPKLSATDFFPPLQASSEEEKEALQQIQHPDEVSCSQEDSGEEIIRASTAQDAFNAAAARKKIGCLRAEFGSGYGWVATGMGTYTKMPDLVASRISKRNAYLAAYMMAKKELAQALGGLSSAGKTRIRDDMLLISKQDDSLKAFRNESEESLEQVVQKFLKGFVLYSMVDDEDTSSVYVSIVSTPKTRGRFNRPDPESLEAASIQEGLDMLLTEISTGLVPPLGGKMIYVPQTGEMAFVGFGSAVVRVDKDPAVHTKMLLQAERAADMRAADALCGVILGDETLWRGKLDERTSARMEDFETAQKEDPISFTVDGQAFTELQSRKNSFINTLKQSDQYESLRRGILPPGVVRRTWTEEDGAFAYGVSVYLPSATEEAKKDSAEMDNADLLAPEKKEDASRSKEILSGDVEWGPSGKVHDEKNL